MNWLQQLPAKVDVYEVGPRDGLQNEPRVVPTDEKVKLIQALMAAGEKRIEVSSFVPPQWIPQLSDAEAVLSALPRTPDVVFSALVPNLRGLERAQKLGLQEAAFFLSASESHSRKNINKSVSEAVKTAQEVTTQALADGMRVRIYLSTVWGCPFEGKVPLEHVLRLVKELSSLGAYQISLGDTIGVGTPKQTQDILNGVLQILPSSKIALHLHDTRGTAMANALVGLSMGVATFDSSIGGLGGCPYAPGASGNLSTEDLVYMLSEMGIETGIELSQLVQAGVVAQEAVGRTLPSKYLQAQLGVAKKSAQAKQGASS